MELAYKALKQFFGYDTFRPMQAEIIESIMDGNDALVLMPTGGGKSICFQIPAIVMEGTCIVVSPLIALMKDQVEGLKANGVPAAYINSTLSWQDEQLVERQAIDGTLKLLYVSPEKLLTSEFKYFMSQITVSAFAIDEAHCISSWGHDFRPEYTKMRFLRNDFPNTPIIALTATADKITRKDIIEQLNIKDGQTFLGSFDRPNLSLSVLPGQNRYKTIEDFVRNHPDQSGIIYCLSRKNTETVSAKLRKAGFNAAFYHAGMSPDDRSRTQEAFIKDDVPIICATIAFGMGIDKSNVRWIIHYSMPKNMEGYYQEIGRAGRDGVKSETVLFYSFGDVIQHRRFIEDGENKEVQYTKLERMIQYADAQICRRKILLSYFGEHTQQNCGNCDVCLSPPEYFDGTVLAQKALSAVVRMREKVSTGTLIDVLRGAQNQNVLEHGYQNVKTYGAGRDHSYQDWQQYLMQMVNGGLFEIAYDEGNALKLTPNGTAVLYEKEPVKLIHPTVKEKIAKEKTKKKKPKNQIEAYEEDLFQALRALRRELAQKANVPPYLVFSDATLKHMAATRPVSEPEMMNVSGVGDRKMKLYGEIFINAILDYIQDGAPTPALSSEAEPIEKKKKKKKPKGDTYKLTWELYQQGLTPDEIAAQRELNITTIWTHLARLYEEGKGIDLFQHINQDELEKTLKAIEEAGDSEGLKPIFEHLNAEVPYHKIRLAIAYYNTNVK